MVVFMTDFKIHNFITTGTCQLSKCQIITTGSDLDVEKLFRLRTITCSQAKETQLSVGGSKSVVSIISILGSVAFRPIRHNCSLDLTNQLFIRLTNNHRPLTQ